MPGDEVHEEAAAPPPGPGRTGPRHAAPRKPLLTRLHLPAGKAVALAAMPSALLMGMGLTPQLANAKPLPKNPFKGDACVSAPDKEETEAEQEEREQRADKLKRDLEREQAKREKAAKEKAAGDQGEDADKGSGSGGKADDGGSTKPSDGPVKDKPAKPSEGGGSADKPAPPADDSGEDQEEENPWYDPLGVGKKIEDAFKPKEDKEDKDAKDTKADEKQAPADEEPSKSAPSEPAGSGGGSAEGEDSPDKPAKKSGEKPGGSAKSGSESDGKAAEKAAKDKADEAREKADEAKDDKDRPAATDQSKDGKARDYDAAKDAGKPFPCPVEGDYKGAAEQTPAQIPNQPWYLDASSLTLKGADYEGIVTVTMPNGKTKKAMKYTADALDIGDLHQTVAGPKGTTAHVQAAEGSTSTIRGGKVTMYTEELKGKLFGLIPVTFSPNSPPPLNIPFIYLTDVKVTQAGQFGGNLTIPGLHQWVGK